MTSPTRLRIIYAAAALGLVAMGLLWRSGLLPLTPFLVKYGGDAIWSAMVYALIRFCRPAMPYKRGALLAFGISAAVEFSQLYHAPWIDSIRRMRLGLLVLGNTFNWPDIPAYAVGVLVAALMDWPARHRESAATGS